MTAQVKVKYRRILPIKSLSEVENPWKGVTVNRCILVALVITVVSSGVELVQETLEPWFETAEEAGSEVQDGGEESEPSWWDSLAFWNWGAEDKIDEFRKKRASRQKQPGEKPGPRIRNREIPTKGLLKERD